MCVYSRMTRYCLIADVSDTFFQAIVIHSKSGAQICLIPFHTTSVALLQEFLSEYRSPLPQSLSILASCHHKVPLYHFKGIHCVSIYIFQIYLQSGGTGKSLNICWKLIILEIFLYGHSWQNRSPISKRA